MTAGSGTAVPAGLEDTVVLLGTSEPEVGELTTALGAERIEVPSYTGGGADWSFSGELDAWRSSLLGGEPWPAVVVAAWSPPAPASSIDALDLGTWIDQVEAALAVWAGALGAAATRCSDGGALVAVVERPSPLDAASRGAESAVADGVEAIVRSLARSEGGRGVRVGAVTTPLRLVPDRLVDPAPSLVSYPGTVAGEVAGAVRLLLSPDAAGLTGTVLHADCGRSWR